MKDPILYRLLRPIFYRIFVIYYNPTIVNKEVIPEEGKIIIAGNHKHALDPVFVYACTKRTVYTLAKKALHDGAFGWFFRAVGSIPVEPNTGGKSKTLASAIDHLNNGCAVNLSPEGKRNRTDEILLPFKFGAVIMAQRTNTKIIPYSITGDYVFRSKNLKIEFGKPIDVSKLTPEEANKKLYDKIKKLLIKNR